jgi:pimeloyl-ACP methyl ester carboxylesterase
MAERPEVIDTVRGWIEDNPPATIANALRALAARPDSVTELEAFKRPALIVWGDEDTLTNRDDQEPMLDALDDGELAIIASAGHLSSVESPDAVSAVLIDFVNSLD